MIRVDELPQLLPDRKLIVSRFLELTDYGRSEILAFSTKTGIFLTRNGGKYQLENDQIRHIAGPSPDPAERI